MIDLKAKSISCPINPPINEAKPILNIFLNSIELLYRVFKISLRFIRFTLLKYIRYIIVLNTADTVIAITTPSILK